MQPSTVGANEWPPWFDFARDVARAEIAAQIGVSPEQAEIHGETLRAIDDEQDVALFKVAAGEGIHEIAIDAFGAAVDLEALMAADVAQALDPQAKIEPGLRQAALADPGAIFPILIWLAEPPHEPFEMPAEMPEDLAAIEALDAELRESVAAQNEAIVAAAIDELGGFGLEAGGDTYTPLVWTEATGESLLELATWSSVAWIDEDREVELLLNVARQATFANVVHGRTHQGAPIRGQQQKVAIVEAGSPSTSHPALSSQTNPIRIVRQIPTCTAVASHPTLVMGVIRSTNTTDRGLAPEAFAHAGAACSLRERDLIAASSKMIATGNFVINFSWGDGEMAGTLGTLDRYVDRVTHRLRRNFVVAAGNRGDSWWASRQFVYSPATSYNSLAVGALDDRGTATRMDDTMAGFSSWRNPISLRGDRVKPNMVAPGVNIRTPDINGSWDVADGTSLSAPMVAAGLGLTLQRAGGLYFSPESLRAIMMASATHSVEGGPWSDRDGAGGLDLMSADDTAARQDANWGLYRWSCGPFEERVITEFQLEAGRLFRAALAWSEDPNFPQNATYAFRPSADIDLYLTDISGNSIVRSTTWDNTHEIIEFHSPVTMTAQLRMKRVRCTQDPGFVGWAWFQDI